MRINKLQGFNDYLISLGVHILALSLLGFISVKQAPAINELIIDWVTQETQEIIQEDFAPAGSPNSSARNLTQSPNNQAVQENPLVERITPERNVAGSIEPPVVRPNAKVNSAPSEGSGSNYLSGVISNLGSGQSGNNGFLLEDDDGNITVIKSVLPNPPIVDYGRVKLQFRIRQDGTVEAQSVIPLIIDNPIYTQESVKAIKQWRFSVKSYNKEKAYRITFIFKPE